jgi:DNA-binding IclR family transcriptional regulator
MSGNQKMEINTTKKRRRRPKLAESASKDGTRASSPYLSRSISRALDVLDSFMGTGSDLSLIEISARTKLPEASVYRILMTLQSRKYLLQLEDGSYSLAPKLLHGLSQERAGALRKLLQPLLRSLAREFDETVSSAFLLEDRIQVVDSIESLRDIRATTRIGRVLPPYASAMGKAITAFQDRAIIDQLIEIYGVFKRTERTVVDRARIYEEYEQIRAKGVAFDRGEATEGGICIGIPIFSNPKKVESAISVSIPQMRYSDELGEKLIAAMQNATSNLAAKISKLHVD